ncbi:hypothetical protein SAMN05428938_3678 [Streptomyces sp. KS_5]|nr:hypothetical protein SAMN05428938_3678 [Streptomyces sp. KS_5]
MIHGPPGKRQGNVRERHETDLPPRRQSPPPHGHFPLPPPHRPVHHGPVDRKIPHRPDPPLPGTVGGVGRRGRPGPVEVPQKRMHRLTGHIAMNERLGQPLGKIRRPLQRPQPSRERHGPWPLGPERNPHMPTPDLITGPLDKQPTRRQPTTQPLPDPGNLPLVVLPQHIGGTNEERTLRNGDLEPTVPKREPLPLVRPRGDDPSRFDLKPDHTNPGRHHTKPPEQLDGRPGSSPVPKIDRDRIVAPPQRTPMGMGDPPVHPAQPIRIGGPACHRSHGAGNAGTHTQEGMRRHEAPAHGWLRARGGWSRSSPRP